MNSAKPIFLSLLFVSSIWVSDVLAQRPQVTAAKGTATVAGHVSVDGGALAGIQVMLRRDSEQLEVLSQTPPLLAATDADGNYRFTNVPAGKYRLQVYAPVYVNEQRESYGLGELVNVTEGETIENLNCSLRRGGVVTGKVTDAEGQPIIEATITLLRVDAQGKKVEAYMPRTFLSLNRTDDRGSYRLFGVEAGRYYVVTGGEEGFAGLNGGGGEQARTYHPGTPNEAEAKIIEVKPGLETEGIDIVLGATATAKKFVASGRVIEADTSKPVAGLMLMYGASEQGREAFGISNATTNSQGEFRLENLSAGGYFAAVFNMQAMMGGGSELYAEPVNFEIQNRDVSGIEIKMHRGASISGTAVLDKASDRAAQRRLSGVMLQAIGRSEDSAGRVDVTRSAMGGMSTMAMGTIKPDGTFRVGGIRPGKVSLMAQSMTDKMLHLVRIERDGVTVAELNVNPGEQINGLRLVFAAGTASLSGRVEVRGGTLPPGARISIVVEKQNDTAAGGASYSFAEANSRGQFVFENLLPGTYEVRAQPIQTADHQVIPSTDGQATITLVEGAKQEIVLVVELKQKEDER